MDWVSRQGPGAGFQLTELILVLAVSSMILFLSLPALWSASSRLRVRLAAGELSGVLRLARAYAVRHSDRVGVKFFTADPTEISYALFADGDGDGVRNEDIDSGVDPQVAPTRRLTHFGRHVGFGFPPGRAPRDPGDPSRRLDRLDDPIRFNRSDLASFSPLGGSTPGSLYVTDGVKELMVVRVFGRTGKVRTLRYDATLESWQ